MASPANFRYSEPTFPLMFNLERKSPQNLLSHLLTKDLPKSTRVKFPVIRASSSLSSSSPSNPKPSLLKTTCITLTTSSALFSASFDLISKPAMATPVVTISAEETILETQSNDVEGLLSLAKLKFDSENYDQAIEIMNRLIKIDPYEQQWQSMKARLLSYISYSEAAIKAFEEILAKDSIRVDAYHCLVMEYHYSKPKLTELDKRINKAIESCKKEKKKKEIRELRVLIALIRVIEGNPIEAIRVCEELVKENPGVLFEGMVFLWKNNRDEVVRVQERENRENAGTNMTTKVSQWGVILAYDRVYCYMYTCVKLLIASGLFGDV